MSLIEIIGFNLFGIFPIVFLVSLGIFLYSLTRRIFFKSKSPNDSILAALSGAILLIIASIHITILVAFGSTECSDTAKINRDSPNRKYVVEVISTSCGATTPLSTKVILKEKDSIINSTIQLNSYNGPADATHITWVNNTELQIVSPEKCKQDKNIQTWKDVHLDYICE